MPFFNEPAQGRRITELINNIAKLNIPRMGVPMSMSVFEPGSHDGNKYLPVGTYKSFPHWRSRPAGMLVAYYKALPPGYRLPKNPDNLTWWVDAQFLPHTDNTLVTSVGAYVDRGPNQTSVAVSLLVKGLIYTITFTEETNYNILRGSRSTSLPYVQPHPTSQHICHIGTGTVALTNLSTRKSVEKQKDLRNQNYRFFDVSKCGMYIATIARAGMQFELSVIHQEGLSFVEYDVIRCNHICDGLIGSRTYTELVECRFSSDARLIAVGSSMGQLFVVKRWRLQTQSILAPRTFNDLDVCLSNERSFDFSPMADYNIIAFADYANTVRMLNMESDDVEQCIDVETNGAIESLKYSTRGDMLAVATSMGHVYIYSPKTAELLLDLDGTAVCVDATMSYNHNLGRMPSILHMSFSESSDLLAVSSTDGIVRIWQMPSHMPLVHLCRMAVLKYVTVKQLKDLPLPKKLIEYLYTWPQ